MGRRTSQKGTTVIFKITITLSLAALLAIIALAVIGTYAATKAISYFYRINEKEDRTNV